MKKTVSFYYILICAILSLVTMLFVSCAGGTSSADGDVGYLTFGSSRAASALAVMNVSPNNLTDLELKGTKGGKERSFGTWNTYADISETAVPVPVGSWTFVLTAKHINYYNVTNFYISEQDAVITAGEDTSVTFTMSFAGVPMSEVQTGDVILTNGNIAGASFYDYNFNVFAYPAEAVALVSSSGAVYGININIGAGKNYTWAYNNIPSGYHISDGTEKPVLKESGNYAALRQGFQDLGIDIDSSPRYCFWISTPAGSTGHYYISFEGENVAYDSDDTTSGNVSAVYFKQFR